MSLLTTIPFTRYNNNPVLSDNQRRVLDKHCDSFINKSFVDPKIIGASNDISTRFNAVFLHTALVYVITETVGEYPYPYFTEKTWRGINTGCPFMMVNAKNSLVKLQELGFKTFSCWWDESYDTKDTVADRIDCMAKVLHNLSSLSNLELESLRNEITPIVRYNQENLKKIKEADLKNIANLI